MDTTPTAADGHTSGETPLRTLCQVEACLCTAHTEVERLHHEVTELLEALRAAHSDSIALRGEVEQLRAACADMSEVIRAVNAGDPIDVVVARVWSQEGPLTG